ncbi:MAG: ral secretion pathway protein [Variibacter sp.]|nr:ral secretion pathway protein [Variibacter sp.]
MTGLGDLKVYLARWIDTVAAAIVALLASLRARRSVRITEQDDGSFTIGAERVRIVDGQVVASQPANVENALRGSHGELELKPARFLFRPLELPQRATEFLDGVVRTQIDRLTPWSASDAAFGFGPPQQTGTDRMTVTVAATARALVQPLIDALSGAGAESVAVWTTGPDAVPIRVLDHSARGVIDIARVRRALVAVLIGAGLLAGVSASAAAVYGYKLNGEQEELTRRIAERRAALRAGRETGAQIATPLRALERRKYQTASSVIVLDVLSQILPDHTYVTELRIEGDKLRVIGVTRDAPSLIRLMEQSPHFTRATFFAPTTRAPSDPGERFHIEAQIEPVFAVRS